MRVASLVITHAGHGSVVKALAAGVPLICMPQGRDQRHHTTRVVSAGAGIALSRRAAPAAIRVAVHHVLTHPSYRTNAQALDDAFASEARTRPSALAEVERVLTA